MRIEDIDLSVARLEQQLSDAPHEDDAGAPNERQRRWSHREQLRKWIGVLRSERSTVLEADKELPHLEPWLDFLTGARQTHCDELLACERRSPKIRGLELSIRQIDRGLPFNTEMLPNHLPIDDLLCIAGYQTTAETLVSTCGKGWLGCLPDVERRVLRLRQRRAAAEQRITSLLATIETPANEVAAK